MNVAVQEMDVSFETLVKNERCRARNERFVRDFRKKTNVAVKEMDVSFETLVKNQRWRHRN